MTHPPILTPTLCADGLYRIYRIRTTGLSQPFQEPSFYGLAGAVEFCRQHNADAGRTRDEVLMARMRVKEIAEVTPEVDEVDEATTPLS